MNRKPFFVMLLHEIGDKVWSQVRGRIVLGTKVAFSLKKLDRIPNF